MSLVVKRGVDTNYLPGNNRFIFNDMISKKLEKPKGHKEQLDMLWDVVTNHMWTKLSFLDWKVNFLMLLVIALLTVVLMN